MRIETLAVHAGHSVDPSTGAVTPPIQLSTTFERSEEGSYPHGYLYSRTSNPNREALEQCLSSLEGGTATVAFASGSAATMSIFQSLSPQDHVLAPKDAYHGTAKLLREIFIPWGLAVTFVDMTDLDQVQKAIQPNTKLIWTETPSNPLLKITNIREVSNLAHQIGAQSVCDNTWATPVLQRPLEHGADLVLHATTKYLGGHSDVLGGAVISKVEDGFFQKIRAVQQTGGAVPSPFDCWLTLRGIRTLPYRMRAHSENALKIAQFLDQHPAVENVYYPGLQKHPGHDLANQQMNLFGGMLSFQVTGGQNRAMEVCSKVKLFTRATSLGGTESLIEHRASMEGPKTQTPDNLLRASIGLEHIDDLLEDLMQAL
jgi:cystathionine gamma-synthase